MKKFFCCDESKEAMASLNLKELNEFKKKHSCQLSKKYLLHTIFSDKDMAIKYQQLFQYKLGLTLAIKEIDEKTELNILSGGDLKI